MLGRETGGTPSCRLAERNIYHVLDRKSAAAAALSSRKGSRHMAGRYEGYHSFADKDGEFEVYWENGWFWRPRSSVSSLPDAEAVGPFVTSTEAYQNARGEPRAERRKRLRTFFRREPRL
jgi:hypothetical protein